jgi:hypothetical protein
LRLDPTVLTRALLASVLVSVACEPQDVHLFESLPASNSGGTGGVAPVVVAPVVVPPGDSDDQPSEGTLPFVPTQPACQTPACRACVEADSCVFGTSPGLCHPWSGQCAPSCDPAASETDTSGVCPRGYFCHPEYELCVTCRDRADCAAPTAACDPDRGVCVECIDRTTCSAPLPACDTAAQTCVECASADDCQAALGGRVCDTTTASCVQCAVDTDCGGETLRCRLDAHTCVECLSDLDCRQDPAKPRCKLDEFECDDGG